MSDNVKLYYKQDTQLLLKLGFVQHTLWLQTMFVTLRVIAILIQT